MKLLTRLTTLALAASGAAALAQTTPTTDPASLAFEEGRWRDAIAEYESILEERPEDRTAWLRIAQAQRELGAHERALQSLEAARAVLAPEGMVELERARNYLALGRRDDALAALEAADHAELRALELLEEGAVFDPLRDSATFERVYRSVRSRVYPCESLPETEQFDFWLGEWEVRQPDGTLVGRNTITKENGGCAVREQWRGSGGATGTSLSFYLPSRDEWRQVWVGSSGTMIDMTGGLEDGAMRMEGTIEYAHLDRVVAFRASWTVADDGRVRQRMEEFNLGNNGWQLWFDGIYERVPD